MKSKHTSVLAGIAVALFSVGFVACGSGSDSSNNVTPAVTSNNGPGSYNYTTGNYPNGYPNGNLPVGPNGTYFPQYQGGPPPIIYGNYANGSPFQAYTWSGSYYSYVGPSGYGLPAYGYPGQAVGGAGFYFYVR